MYMLENVPLSGYSTMRLGGNARYLTEINNRSDIPEAMAWAKQRNLPVIMIGGGSNTVWKDEGFDGLVLINQIMGLEIVNETGDITYVTAGAGENWDSVVERVVAKGFSGIEQLSLIPGKVGAAPVQNIGAYGRELDQVLSTVEAYDTQQSKLVNLLGTECGFAYRTSRFKTTDKDKYFITAITLSVTKTPPTPPFYKDIQKYFEDNHVTTYTPEVIRQAVISIRNAKLPDVSKVANCGSFFHNPILDQQQFTNLIDNNPELSQAQTKWSQRPFWEMPNGSVKVSAARLIELAGFDNYHDPETGIGQWPNQNLILVNEHAGSTANLIKFRDRIVAAVKAKFGIELSQEPEILP